MDENNLRLNEIIRSDENNFRLNELIRRIAEGDKQAQVDLLYEYGRYIKTAALATSNKISSDDVVISILTKIVMNAEKIAKKEVTTAWLYKISVNETKNTERNESKFYKRHCRISDETAADLYIKEEERLLSKLNFERIISILDKDEKTIIILKCVYDMTFTQMANELNKPVSTISTQYYSVLGKIKKLFPDR